MDNLLNFTVKVHPSVLPGKHELIQSYNASFNVTLSKFIERLSSNKLCSGITFQIQGKKSILSNMFCLKYLIILIIKLLI